jgi:hypothetical protein
MPKATRNAKVSGYLAVDGRRLDFVDGYVYFDCEPLEWNRYSLFCRLNHQSFTAAQINEIRSGWWVDLNHQDIPPGFPGPKTANGSRLSPFVGIDIGRWDNATRPIASRDIVGLHVGYFLPDFAGNSFGVLPGQVTRCVIDLTSGVMVDIRTIGTYEYRGHKYEWDIAFAGRSYADPWPMTERWRGRK